MKLFLVDVVTKKQVLEVLVHADTAEAAQAYLKTKFPRCDLQNAHELADEPKHFVLAETERT